jgi:hypothetical protein
MESLDGNIFKCMFFVDHGTFNEILHLVSLLGVEKHAL